MRVKFTADYLYETEGRNKGPTFKTGEIKEFREDIAQRFIRRGVAVNADDAPAPRPSVDHTRSAPPPPPRPPADRTRGAGGESAKGGGESKP